MTVDAERPKLTQLESTLEFIVQQYRKRKISSDGAYQELSRGIEAFELPIQDDSMVYLDFVWSFDHDDPITREIIEFLRSSMVEHQQHTGETVVCECGCNRCQLIDTDQPRCTCVDCGISQCAEPGDPYCSICRSSTCLVSRTISYIFEAFVFGWVETHLIQPYEKGGSSLSTLFGT
jgi:hypothetical protein